MTIHGHKGVHVYDSIDVDKDDVQEVGNKRKQIGTSSDRWCKEAKNSRLERLEEALSQWTKSMSARTESSKAKNRSIKSYGWAI